MKRISIFTQRSELSEPLVTLLGERYQCDLFSSLSEIDLSSDLVIFDWEMITYNPHKELKKIIARLERDAIPVFLSWSTEKVDYRFEAVKLGCSDFFAPPFIAEVVEAKISTHLNLSRLLQKEQEQPGSAQDELLAVQDAAILCLATIARIRDHSTGNHILRTQHYVKALAEYLKHKPGYSDELDDETINIFYKTASLHDIGKVGIPDQILQKPDLLTEPEYEVMKKHTLLGYQAVHSAEKMLEHSSNGKVAHFLQIAQQVTLSHHERWDGSGYPQGLAAEEIPIVARLMSVADVYDAMISRRPYKSELRHQQAVDAILEGRGTQFDPEVVDAFTALQETFEHISTKLEDYFPYTADLTLHSLPELTQ